MTIDLRDLGRPIVRIGTLERKGKWVEFYTALAVCRTDPQRHSEYLNRDQLHRMLSWCHGTKLDSIGKMVARECQGLRDIHGLDIIDSSLRTKCWRLAIPAEAVAFEPDRDSVVHWLQTRTWVSEVDDGWIEELEILAAAQIALQEGRGEQTLELIRGRSNMSQPDFEAWRGLLDARATDISSIDVDGAGALEPILTYWESRMDVVGRSVAARVAARVALRMRFSELDGQWSKLNKIAADLEKDGDVSALATVLNILGILAARMGAPEKSGYYHRRAAGLFGLIGDYNSLQAALFNLANSRNKARVKLSLEPDDGTIKLLELTLKVCDAFNVGCDSVQGEAAGCHWCLDKNDLESARAFIERGAAIVEHLDSEYEQACYLFARGRLQLLDGQQRDGTRDLGAARRLFAKVGDRAAIAEIDKLLDKLELR